MGRSGAFRFSKATQQLRVTSGPLKGRIAHFQSSPKKAVVFKRNENLDNGKPTVDDSTTYCYFGRA